MLIFGNRPDGVISAKKLRQGQWAELTCVAGYASHLLGEPCYRRDRDLVLFNHRDQNSLGGACVDGSGIFDRILPDGTKLTITDNE